jgi:putative SOS response-associated peptidase YedK
MSARSRLSSRSRPNGRHQIFRQAGTWRRPTPCPSSATTPRPGSAASTCCAGACSPYWAKDIKVGFANINAKAEGIESKPAFRKAFERRRCLVPVDNFYEWRKTATGKQPYALALADRGIMALAGLWENWKSPAGEWVRSFAIVTTTPNELCAQIHNRMPVILKPEAWPAWLGEEPADEPQLKSLLAPYPAEEMICWPISARVGNVRNNDSSLIEPVAGAAEPNRSAT